MKTTIALLGLLLAAGTATAESFPFKGDPVDPESTLTIDLPENVSAEGARVPGVPPFAEVPNVTTGQRIALPRDASGACRTDAVVTISGGPSVPMEVDPDGRHWTQHTIATRVQTTIDPAACEVVVDEASGRDHVRKRRFKRHLPRGVEVPAPTPEAALPRDVVSGWFDVSNPCIVNRFRTMSRRDLLQRGSTIARARSQARQIYFDYPWQAAFILWYFSDLQWTAGNYVVSLPQSAIESGVSPFAIWHRSTELVIHQPTNAGFVEVAQTYAAPGGYHAEACWGRDDVVPMIAGVAWTHVCSRLAGVYDAFWEC